MNRKSENLISKKIISDTVPWGAVIIPLTLQQFAKFENKTSSTKCFGKTFAQTGDSFHKDQTQTSLHYTSSLLGVDYVQRPPCRSL